MKDLEDFKEAKEITDNVPMTTIEYTTLVKNVKYLEIDILGLNKLSGEMLGVDLKAKDVRDSIDRDRDMKGYGLTKAVQLELLTAVKRSGEPKEILNAINLFEDTREIAKMLIASKEELKVVESKIDEGMLELKRHNVERLRHKTYMDIFDALIMKHSFDPVSTQMLLNVAEKHGNPPNIIGAINVYADLKEIKKNILEAQAEFTVIETKKIGSEAQFRELEKLNAEANQVLGEIKANHDQSMRLQLISNLIREPAKTQATPEELSRVTVALLEGVADCAKSNQNLPPRFTNLVKLNIEPTIQSIHSYLRVS